MKKVRKTGPLCDVVRKEGLEPPYPFGYQILSLARLPVPPLSRKVQPSTGGRRFAGAEAGQPGLLVAVELRKR